MATKILSDAEVMREASRVLLEHLDPAVAARFWAGWQSGQGDYLLWREAEFGQETVGELYDEIVSYEQNQTLH